MKVIEVHTQKQFDKLPDIFGEYTEIRITDTLETIYVDKARGNSSVEAWGNSSVVAWDDSSVVARDNSSVVAWDNSSVVAGDNSIVEARDNSIVEARDNSSVVAWDNSSVEARDNSSVEARGNSSVVAWGNVCIHGLSNFVTITLFAFAVCYKLAKFKVQKKSKTCTVIIPIYKKGTSAWLEREGIKSSGNKAILYKKVSKKFETQEDNNNKTLYKIGTIVEIKNWKPENDECGENKLHACSRPYFADEFRNNKGDRYIAIEVNIKDLYVWDNKPQFPHKVAFRKCKVLYEVDKFGHKLSIKKHGISI